MKKFIILIVCCLILLNAISFYAVLADDIPESKPFIAVSPDNNSGAYKDRLPVIGAGAAIVMDMKSGRILYEKNAYSRRPMASTTKIMTAIIAIENGKLDDMVTVSKRAAEIWGSNINLRTGETLKLKDLLYGLMLNSGNDAAIAIAEHIGGTVECFADMMNKKAEELGAKNTHFKSPHGLDMPDHYTTAYDLALITRYALNNPVFSQIVGTKSYYIQNRNLYNTNEMLDIYPGADGVKTGYTSQAGRCLVTSATRDNWRIISVVLNCPTTSVRAQSSRSILDYAFTNYKPYMLSKLNEEIGRVAVLKGVAADVAVQPVEEIVIPLRKDEASAIETRVDLPESLPAPVYAGIEVGSIKYLVNGNVIAQTALKTTADIRRKNAVDYMGDIIKEWGRLMRF